MRYFPTLARWSSQLLVANPAMLAIGQGRRPFQGGLPLPDAVRGAVTQSKSLKMNAVDGGNRYDFVQSA